MDDLKKRLKKAGLSQKELGDILGVSKAWMSKVINSKVPAPRYVIAYLDLYTKVKSCLHDRRK